MSRFIRRLTALTQPGDMNRFMRHAAYALLSALSIAAVPVCAAAPAAPPSAPAVAVGIGPDYRIGPGDSLQIYVWQNPDLSVTVPVRQDGRVSTPLVEDMLAAGKTASQLARDIERVLTEYVKSPKVNVFVLIAVSALSEVKVTGQVKTPKALPYHEGMTVLDAVLAVGGLTDFAAGNRAKVVRTVDGKQQEIKVRLGKLLEGGDMSQNISLRPGDVLLVPESRF
jgi:polysaccharide biosynthesis/export protein